MAYTFPTVEAFTTRFPAFAAVDSGLIDAVMQEAGSQVDATWTERDYAPAILLLTAHILVTEGALLPSGLAPVGVSSGPIVSETLGDATTTYAFNRSTGANRSDNDLGTTPYGRRFLALMQANVGGPIVI